MPVQGDGLTQTGRWAGKIEVRIGQEDITGKTTVPFERCGAEVSGWVSPYPNSTGAGVHPRSAPF